MSEQPKDTHDDDELPAAEEHEDAQKIPVTDYAEVPDDEGDAGKPEGDPEDE